MSRISPSEQKNQALREMFEHRFEAGAERELMLSELIRLTTEKTLQEMLELEQSEHLGRERYERGERPAARELLDSLADSASGEWMFPSEKGDEPLTKHALYSFWFKARDIAGVVADARLHDLRHLHASHAVMNGESLHVAGRLLGHRRASTTNRYVHLDDATLSQAAERVANALKRKLG